jgi:hypothetical protein
MDLNSILIGSENPQGLRDYYNMIFGKPAFEEGDFSGWQIGGGWVTVGPHDQVKGKNRDAGE